RGTHIDPLVEAPPADVDAHHVSTTHTHFRHLRAFLQLASRPLATPYLDPREQRPLLAGAARRDGQPTASTARPRLRAVDAPPSSTSAAIARPASRNGQRRSGGRMGGCSTSPDSIGTVRATSGLSSPACTTRACATTCASVSGMKLSCQ